MRAAPLVVAVLLLAVSAAASWRDVPASDFTMAPPPAAGSPESDKDYAELLKLQASRTPDECALAAAQAIPEFQPLFGDSGILTKAETDAVSPFIGAAAKIASAISGHFKKQFTRPRPYDADPRVKPCIPKPGGTTSYPSYHATAGAFEACLLGRLFPKRADILAVHGRRVGDLRVLGGVHHPTDVAAGRLLGEQICARFLKEPDFLAELAEVKKSLP